MSPEGVVLRIELASCGLCPHEGQDCALQCDPFGEKYCFASTRGAAKRLFWTSSEWKPAAVTFDRHDFRLGKTEVHLFWALERLFGHIRLQLRSMLEDAGHI